MLKEFQAVIEPLNKDLGLALRQSEDYTIIPVTIKHKSGTTQVIEDGIVTECDHAGSDHGSVELAGLYYNPFTESVEERDTEYQGLVCDQCPAWQDVAGEWHE